MYCLRGRSFDIISNKIDVRSELRLDAGVLKHTQIRERTEVSYSRILIFMDSLVPNLKDRFLRYYSYRPSTNFDTSNRKFVSLTWIS